MAFVDPAQSARPAASGPAHPAARVLAHSPARVAARAMMWNLETDGWTEREAGNLVGLFHGLRPALSGWSEREIEHLRFLRVLVETGRVGH